LKQQVSPLIGAVVTLALSGCAKSVAYKPPLSGSVARLSVPKFKSSYRLLGGFFGGAVGIAKKNADGCAGPSMEIPLDKAGSGKSVAVPAEQDIFISLFRYWGNTSCRIHGLVKLKANTSYRVKFGTLAKSCFFSVSEAGSSGAAAPIKLRPAKMGLVKLCAG